MSHRHLTTALAIVLCGATWAADTPVTPDVPIPDFDPGWSHLDTRPWTVQERGRVHDVLSSIPPHDTPENYEPLPGGSATGPMQTATDAFAQPSGNMSFERKLEFQLGNALFEKLWVSSPSSTKASDGLGPLYNARACQSCHIRDGRGEAPQMGSDRGSLLFRIAVPTTDGSTVTGDPVYGHQLQDRSLPEMPAEGQIDIQWRSRDEVLADGTIVTLRVPDHRVHDLGWGPMSPGANLSPRIAPPMIGLGLIEAIPTQDILAGADPKDEDGDGISGRAAVVWSDSHQRPMLGRFGLKATSATIRDQSAAAFLSDIGLSTSLHPAPWGDCTTSQTACRTAPHGDRDARIHEVDDATLDQVTFYSRNLAVPGRRDIADPEVLRGKTLFHDSGCADCHRPRFVTHRLANQPEQSFQLIWPYSDLLLHDMGPDLADAVPQGQATGREWRTPPLWGIGLTQIVTPGAGFLHDGRARNLLEAILWHDGEAARARDAVRSLSAQDRDALLRFLNSL